MTDPSKKKVLIGILLGCGGLLFLAALGGGGLAWWFLSSKPDSGTIHAGRESVVGDVGGAQVTVPAGAVDRDVRIGLLPRPPETRVAPGARVVGRVWSVQVDGQDHFAFKKPVRVALPLERALVKDGSAVSMSRWEKDHWRKLRGSRVEGDRVIADVDHFSEVAPTQDEVPKQALSENPFLNVDVWTAQVDLSIQASWGHSNNVGSSDWSISRSASLVFRLSHSGFFGSESDVWSVRNPHKAPEDAPRGHVSLNDGGYRTDDDYDHNGNVFYYTAVAGAGAPTALSSCSLDIDTRAGTWVLSGYANAGKVVGNRWSNAIGGRDMPYEEQLNARFRLGPRPLPAAAGEITASIPVTKNDVQNYISSSPLSFDSTMTGRLTVTLTPGPPGLKARIGGPSLLRRGDQVTLDGSASTGDIAGYLWTFTVGSGCPEAAGKVTTLTGPRVTFHALWDFKAELEVKDSAGKKASASHDVTVKARQGADWQVKFATKRGTPMDAAMSAGLADLENSTAPEWTPAKKTAALVGLQPLAGGVRIGINQCVPHPETFVSGHYLHTTDEHNKTWLDAGYDLVKVGDEGPFAGLFFVSKQRLEIDRVERLNQQLLQTGSKLYEINTRHRNAQAVANLLSQAKEHESLHSTLAHEKLLELQRDRKDAAAELEAVIGLQYESTKRAADKTVEAAHLQLLLAANEEQVKKRLAKNPKYQKDLVLWLPMKLSNPNVLDSDGKPVVTEIEVDKNFGPLYAIGDE